MSQTVLLIIILITCIVLLFLMFRLGYIVGINNIPTIISDPRDNTALPRSAGQSENIKFDYNMR